MLLGQVHFLNFNFFCFRENCILWYDIFAFCWTWFRLTQLCCQGKKCFLFWLKLCLPVQIQSKEQDYMWVNLWHATSINMLILPHNCQNGVLIYHCWQKQEILFNQSKKHKTWRHIFLHRVEKWSSHLSNISYRYLKNLGYFNRIRTPDLCSTNYTKPGFYTLGIFKRQ